MRLHSTTFASLALALTGLVPAAAFAHGGGFRDPGEVPPDSREPGDPPPPPDATPSRPRPEPRSDWKSWWDHNEDSIVARRRRRAANGVVVCPRVASIPPEAQAIRNLVAEPLRALLASPGQHFVVRSAAVIALARAGDVSVADDLRRIVADDGALEHRYVRESAALALGLLGEKSPETRAFLAEFVLGDRDDSFARPFAAISLGLLGADDDGIATGALLDVIARPEPRGDVKPACLLALGLLGGDRVVEELVAMARHGRASSAGAADLTETETSFAVAALGMIGKPGERDEAFDTVLRLARGDDGMPRPDVRRSAVIALARLALGTDWGRRDRAVELLRDLVDDGGADEPARLFALTSLGRIGGAADTDGRSRAEIAAFLGRMMRTGEGHVPAYSALALGHVDRHRDVTDVTARERDVLVPLRAAFAAGRPTALRGAAAVALGMCRDPFAVDALLVVVRDEHANAPLRGWCALALGMIGDLRAAEPVRELMGTVVDRDVRLRCATAAGLFGDDEAVPGLLDVLRDRERSQYEIGSAALALGRIGDARAIDALLSIANDAEDAYPNLTRALAVVALGQIADRRDVPLLARVATDINYRASVPAITELLSIL